MSNVSITNLHTYAGFGISIGSHTEGGINNVLVDTVDQAGYYPNTGSAGLKIKSSSDRGGVVNNVTYQHICQQNERFAIRIYPYYTNPSTTADVPTYTNIKVHDMTVLANSSGSSGRFVFQGYNANHMTTLWLDNLNVMGTPDTSSNAPQDVAITLAGPVNPTALQQLNGTGVSYAGSASASTETPYPCSASNFQQITGELLLSTANGTNLQSLSVSPSDSFTLNAVVQPATAESAALSNPITFYDGGTAVGTAAISGNGTLATLSLSNVSSGTHTYTAQYPADSNYSSFSFGSVTVNVSGSTTTTTPLPLPFHVRSYAHYSRPARPSLWRRHPLPCRSPPAPAERPRWLLPRSRALPVKSQSPAPAQWHPSPAAWRHLHPSPAQPPAWQPPPSLWPPALRRLLRPATCKPVSWSRLSFR